MTALAILLATVALTPLQKAQLMVVTTERPRIFDGAAHIRFADQEGGLVKALPAAPPWRAASGFTTAAQALRAGRETRTALRRAGIDLDFAPVLDAPDGPLGSRQFRSGKIAVAFARGLGDAACVKHFPGLGTAAVSTDDRPHVDAHVRPQDLAPFRATIRAGVPCVMVSNAFYGTRFRASIEPSTYRRLRRLGFRGVAITDSLSLVRAAPVERWARQAARAGADMVLFTSPAQARRAIRALLPLARRGELDSHVERILRLRTLVRGRSTPPLAADASPGSTPRQARLATFAGHWWGHTRVLRITRNGHAAESLFSGCCERVVNLDFRLSRPEGAPRNATAVATVTAVWVADPSAFTKAAPPPRVGETRTLRLRGGVITEGLTGADYCAPRIDKCGA